MRVRLYLSLAQVYLYYNRHLRALPGGRISCSSRSLSTMPPKRKSAADDNNDEDASGSSKKNKTDKKPSVSKGDIKDGNSGSSGVEPTKGKGKGKQKESKDGGGSAEDPYGGGIGAAAATAEIPKKNKQGQLVFDGYPKFRPNLTPKEVMQLGSFGGSYFRPIRSSVTNKSYKNAWKDFPPDWFEGLHIAKQVANPNYVESLNKYAVHCGGDLQMWESNGWMRECDPYGWFQWYCRFYLGRRCDDDDRQISRGLKVFGPTGRWRTQLYNRIITKDTYVDDESLSPKIRQLLQHWGYKPNEADLKAHAKKSKK